MDSEPIPVVKAASDPDEHRPAHVDVKFEYPKGYLKPIAGLVRSDIAYPVPRAYAIVGLIPILGRQVQALRYPLLTVNERNNFNLFRRRVVIHQSNDNNVWISSGGFQPPHKALANRYGNDNNDWMLSEPPFTTKVSVPDPPSNVMIATLELVIVNVSLPAPI